MLACEMWDVAPSCWNIQLRLSYRPLDIQRCWRFPYMRLLWSHRRRWDQFCAAGTTHTKHQSSLNEGVLHVSRWDFHIQFWELTYPDRWFSWKILSVTRNLWLFPFERQWFLEIVCNAWESMNVWKLNINLGNSSTLIVPSCGSCSQSWYVPGRIR